MKKYVLITISLLCAQFANATSSQPQNNGVAPTAAVDSTSYKPTKKFSAVPEPDGYKLVWHDEFDTDGLPSKEWTYEQGFVRNHELQWYQDRNATVADGCLEIEGRKEQVPNPNYVANSKDWKLQRKYAEYTSSSLTTRNSFAFHFGRIEVRAKIPTATGSWPAIWMLGNKWDWPNNGEIDILEYYIKNGRPSILANACWGDKGRWQAVWNESVTPFSHFTSKDKNWSQKFHVWRMDWDEHLMSIYVDDELMNQIDLTTTYNRGYDGNYENPFTSGEMKHYIVLNLALGGNGGTPDIAAFPLKYQIDYVRVYQK